MATTKVIKDLTEFNPGNPDYVLNATNAVTVINSGGNQYNFNGVYGKFGLRIGTTVLTGVPSGHPIAVLNDGLTGITYTGTVNEGTANVPNPGGPLYTFYSGDVTITVTADFGVASYYCLNHGYMGGQDNLVSVYSDAGLKMPTGVAFSGSPSPGMMRNDTTQSSASSASTMQHYNGTDWKNFVNVVECTTATCDYPTTATLLYQMESDGGSANNVPDTCSAGLNGTSTNITYAAGGKYGNAAIFPNPNSSTSTGIISGFAPSNMNTTSYTFSQWVYFDDIDDEQYIVSNYLNTSGSYGFYMIKTANVGNIIIDIFNTSNAQTRITSTALSAGQWYNLVLTWNHSTQVLEFYIDGVLDQTSSAVSGTVSTNSNALRYGRADSAAANDIFTGKLDQVRVFPSALTQSQITNLANEVGC